MDRLAERFGKRAVIGGVCLIAGDQAEDGTILQLTPLHSLTYGELSGETSDRIHELDTVLSQAGFDTDLSAVIEQPMWEKWVQLASVGAVTCLFRGPIGEVVAVTGGRDLATRVIQEAASVATACGHSPGSAFLDRLTAAITQSGSMLTSSMYRDLIKGRHVEVQAILADMCDRGREHGVETALLSCATVALYVHENRVSAA